MAKKSCYRPEKNGLTDKQKKFADEYLIDCNATQAAIRAGYSKKTAHVIGDENLKKPKIRTYLEERMAEKEKGLIATQDEVLRYLTSVLRGESEAEDLAVEGIGKGCSKARNVRKAPSELDRLKAAEQLSKCYGLYNRERLEIEREKLAIERERLELEKQRNSISSGDEDTCGVVVLAPILEDEDDA